jgi:Rap1a immunity proteins
MRIMCAVATLFTLTLSAFAGEIPAKSFFSGNDVYQWCQHDKMMAQAYVAGMYDEAAHGAAAIDDMRHFSAMPKNDVEVDFALDRVAGFCMPEHATLEQITDVFCAYLRDSPAKRDGLPSIMFNDALKQAWGCPGK